MTLALESDPMTLGCQTGNEIRRFWHPADRTIKKRGLVAVHDPAVAIYQQALGGYRRAGL